MKSLTEKEFLERARNVHGDKYDYSLTNFKGANSVVDIYCKAHNVWFQQKACHHYNGSTLCKECLNEKKKKLRKPLEQLFAEFRSVHGLKYDYSLIKEPPSDSDKIFIICPIHGVFKQKVRNHLNGDRCPGCGDEARKKPRVTFEEFVKRSINVHGFKYDYSLAKEDYKGTKRKVRIICPIHGVFEQTPNKHMQKRGCKKCKESYGEKAIRVFLEKNKIEYSYNHIFNDFYLPYDFYISSKNLVIEFDGEQHYSSNNFFTKEAAKRLKISPEEVLSRQKERDLLKDKYCLANKISIIRIKKIEEVNSILKDIFENSEGIDLLKIKKEDNFFKNLLTNKVLKKRLYKKAICIETGEIVLKKNEHLHSKVLLGETTYKGYHWRNIDENEIGNEELIKKNNEIFLSKIPKKKHKLVHCEELNLNFNSIMDAVEYLTSKRDKSKSSNISRAIANKTKSLGYHWSYLSDFERFFDES